jgi:hypothetical protein
MCFIDYQCILIHKAVEENGVLMNVHNGVEYMYKISNPLGRMKDTRCLKFRKNSADIV